MSTEFAISRFLVPTLAQRGLALSMDCDMLVRANLARLFDYIQRQESKAVWCVKHQHSPASTVKMDGQVQSTYERKNWTSLIVFDCDHPANKALTVAAVNKLTGRELHRLCWLADDDIGELDLTWNWLAGESEPMESPNVCHHTLGSPCMAGYEDAPFASEWRAELNMWAAK